MQAILVVTKLLLGLDIDDVGCDELACCFDLIAGQMLEVEAVRNVNLVRGVNLDVYKHKNPPMEKSRLVDTWICSQRECGRCRSSAH